MARKRPIDERVVRLKSGEYLHEREYVPRGRFASRGMYDTASMRRTKFVTVKPPGRPDVRLVVGCLPADTTRTVCRRTTVQKSARTVSPRQASALKKSGVRAIRKNPAEQALTAAWLTNPRKRSRKPTHAEGLPEAHGPKPVDVVWYGRGLGGVRNPRSYITLWAASTKGLKFIKDLAKRWPLEQVDIGSLFYLVPIALGPASRAEMMYRSVSFHRVPLAAEQGLGRERNPQLMVVGNPGRRKANPSLMVISNPSKRKSTKKRSRKAPLPNSPSAKLAGKAYKRFHFTRPAKTSTGWVPDGWPKTYVTIGQCLRLDVKGANGKKVVRNFSGANAPRLCTTAGMKDVYLFGNLKGIPSGTALRVDYRVPSHSKRRKWASDWTHDHDSRPRLTAHSSGKAVRISGKKLKVTPRGIEG